MPSKSSAPITVRLSNSLIDAIQAEAEALGFSRSEVVARRLTRTFLPAPDVRKPGKNCRETDSSDTELGDAFE